MDYIKLEIKTDEGWQSVTLPSDVSISIEETSPLWNTDTGGAFSYPFQIDIDENLHIFKTAGYGHGSSIYSVLKDARFRLYVGGNVFKNGTVKLEDSVDIEIDEETGHHLVSISLESSRKEFSDVLDGVKIRDLDIAQYKIQIGYCLPERVEFSQKYDIWYYSNKHIPVNEEIVEYSSFFSPPRTLISDYHDNVYDGKYTYNFTNVSLPYEPSNPLKSPFCNVRVCYPKRTEDDNDNDSTSAEVVERVGVRSGEPNRVNSAPCFYFGFIHDELFKQLHISVTSNALNDLMDYRRLAFFHTNCGYDSEVVKGVKFANDCDDNNFKFSISIRTTYNKTVLVHNDKDTDWERRYCVLRMADSVITTSMELYRAYANEENLPDIEANEMVEATQSAFGARYIYDSELSTLKVVLVRDILADTSINSLDSLEVTGDIYKTENDVRGIRFKYSASNEMSQNTITKKEYLVEGSDETTYNYNDYRYPYVLGKGEATYDESTGELSYSMPDDLKLNDYYDLITHITDNDLHLYIDPITGNAYRIKVDADAETADKWYPSLFQVAGYRDVTLGDVSDDDYVEEITIPFSPVVPNNANFRNEYDFANYNETDSIEDTPQPVYAQYMDADIVRNDDDSFIEHKYKYTNVMLQCYLYDKNKYTNALWAVVDYDQWAIEDYDVSSSSDGPYYDNEPEFVLGIMRGSGAEAQTIMYDEDYDGEGHAHYLTTAGTEAEFTSDTMDTYGDMFDYNGGGTTHVKPSEVRSYLVVNYPDSNIDILKVQRAFYMQHYNGMYVVATYMTDDSVGVLSETWIGKYQSATTKDALLAIDKNNYNIIVGIYDSYDDGLLMLNLVTDLTNIYWTNTAGDATFPENGLGYSVKDLISLKLKTEIPIDGDPSKGYYPVSNPLAQKRGLADKFYGAYFHWVLNRKTANIPCNMPDADINSIDWFKRYNIADYVGYVNKKTYTITQDGISNMKLQMYYL